jgi:hypothetical protein
METASKTVYAMWMLYLASIPKEFSGAELILFYFAGFEIGFAAV